MDRNRVPSEQSLRFIKNKVRRNDTYAKIKHNKCIEKSKRRKRKQTNPDSEEFANVPKQNTIENTREYDEGQLVDTQNNDDTPLKIDDEFVDYFEHSTTPKVAITISSDKRPSKLLYELAEEFCQILPNAVLSKKRGLRVNKFSKELLQLGFTDMILFGEDKKQPNRMILSHLSNGGLTAMFKLSSLKLPREIHNHGKQTEHKPELILNNFTTILGHRIGTMFAVLFPHMPEFEGRQVATFHNQRDFIFFRYHRYIFDDDKRAGLQELGPQFTLKLKWIQKGFFNNGENVDYEWVLKRHEMETSRKKFFL